MSAIGLWYPVYDRRLAWVGVSLETDTSIFVPQNFFDQMSSEALAVEGVNSKLFFVGADVLGACKQPLKLPFSPSRLVAVLSEISCRPRRAWQFFAPGTAKMCAWP